MICWVLYPSLRARKIKFERMFTTLHVSYVTYHVSHVTCNFYLFYFFFIKRRFQLLEGLFSFVQFSFFKRYKKGGTKGEEKKKYNSISISKKRLPFLNRGLKCFYILYLPCASCIKAIILQSLHTPGSTLEWFHSGWPGR